MQTTALIKAIREKDIKRLTLLLANGADVNEADERGWKALFEASSKGYMDVVKLLLENGAEINAQDRIGRTALVIASAEGHIDMIKFLLDHGAMIDITSENTPKDYRPDSILFCTIGYPDITRLFLRHGADVNAKDSQGYTVLASALDAECLDTAYVLLEHISEMSDINARTQEGHTALMYAEKNGYTDIVRILKNAGAKDDNIETALINTAGMTGRMDMIEYFIGKGANVNAQDDYGHSALIEATLIEDSKIIQYLIDHGADVNIKDNQGVTALSVAQHYGYRDVIDLLNKAGAKE